MCKLCYKAYSDLAAAETRLPIVTEKMTMPKHDLTAACIAVILATSFKGASFRCVIDECHICGHSSAARQR